MAPTREQNNRASRKRNASEKRKAWLKDYYAKNREKLNARAIEWRKNNKEKARRITLKHKWGLSPEEVPETCQACGSAGDNKGICVDHCHDTNKIRGFLCHGCNVAIGYAKNSTTILRQLAEYLERHYGP